MDRSRIDRFRILVCVDGSDECYRGIRFAARWGSSSDADIFLLYVRPVDQGMRTGGLQIRVARENMLEWGLELPGIKYLKQGRDMLIEMGVMGDDWNEEFTHYDAGGDPLGDNKIVYTTEDGKFMGMKLMVSPTVEGGIIDQCDIAPYDLVILGAAEKWRSSMTPGFLEKSVSQSVAKQAPTSVLVARELEAGHGHLLCVNGSEKSMEAARWEATVASRFDCNVSLMCVAEDDTQEEWAKENVARARAVLEEAEVKVIETYTPIGDPVQNIVDTGKKYSVIVLSGSDRGGFSRFFQQSVAYKVMQQAENSVLIARERQF